MTARTLAGLALFAGALAGTLAAPPALAADDDAAYCQKLGQMATRFTGSAGAEGRMSPDLAVQGAIEDCRRGRYAAGIAVLERRLRSNGFTLPPRQ